MMSNATMYPVLRWVDLTHDGSTTELMAHFSDCHCSLTTFEALGDAGTSPTWSACITTARTRAG